MLLVVDWQGGGGLVPLVVVGCGGCGGEGQVGGQPGDGGAGGGGLAAGPEAASLGPAGVVIGGQGGAGGHHWGEERKCQNAC